MDNRNKNTNGSSRSQLGMLCFWLVVIGSLIVFVGLPVMSLMHENYPEQFPWNPDSKQITAVFVCILMICFGLWICIKPIKVEKANLKRCTLPVGGVCVDYFVISGQNHVGRHGYVPIWEYEYNGQKYTVRGASSWGTKESVPQTCTLRMNPNDPQDCFEPITTKINIANICLGLLFIIIPMVYLIFLVVEKF